MLQIESGSKNQVNQQGKVLDRVGACASALCAVHCLATGIAMGFLAVAGLGFMAHPAVEASFIAVALFVGGWAVVHGIRRHHSKIPAAIFALGLSMIVASHFVGHEHVESGQVNVWTTILAVSGGTCLALFHFANSKLQHRGCSCPLHRDPEHSDQQVDAS